MPAAIKFSNEKILVLLVQANMRKFCPVAAKVITRLNEVV